MEVNGLTLPHKHDPLDATIRDSRTRTTISMARVLGKFRSWSSTIRSSKQKRTRIRFSASMMEKLPVEIVQYISTFLSISSLACLALTCRSMKEVVGTTPWRHLKRPTEEKHLFLACLEKDTPAYFHCHFCEKLHRPRYLPMHAVHEFTEWHCTLTNGRLNVGTGYHILYEHVQLAMKRHRLGGHHGIPLDVFSYRGSVSTLRHKNEWLEIEARIFAGELLVYRRYTATLKSWVDHRRYERNLRVCPHFGRREIIHDRSNYEGSLLERARCRLKHTRVASCTSCIEVNQCTSCLTDWNIEQNGSRIILTIWKNLGSGESPSDPRWRHHVMYTNSDPVVMRFSSREAGSIKSAWDMAKS